MGVFAALAKDNPSSLVFCKNGEFPRFFTEDDEFECPAWIDPLTGRVYEMSDTLWTAADRSTVFSRLAVYDSAIVIAERKEIERLIAPAKPVATDGPADGPILKSTVTMDNRVSLVTVNLAATDLARSPPHTRSPAT